MAILTQTIPLKGHGEYVLISPDNAVPFSATFDTPSSVRHLRTDTPDQPTVDHEHGLGRKMYDTPVLERQFAGYYWARGLGTVGVDS